MADVKISALPVATTPLAGTELVPIVQSGVTEQVTVANLTAGRTVGAATLNVDANSATDAVRITQTGAGNALVVEDSTNPDATPFVVNAAGTLLAGYTTPLALDGKIQVPVGGATISAITTNAGSTSARSHWRLGISDVEVGAIGTIGTSMTFLTNAITRMQITETGNTTITAVGTGGVNGTALTVTGTNLSGATTNVGISIVPTFGLGATVRGIGVQSTMNTEAGGAGLATAAQFRAVQGTLSTAVTSQYGFWADSTLIGATNNYGFYSNIASGTGRWNFYAAGTADNYFAGDMQLDKTVTAAGTTGAQTINKNAGTVNFAAAATSLVVTNSRVTSNSIIIATVATNDTTMKSVIAVAGAGSFTLTANAAATAETRVNWLVIN
jgi:hypothetical protein